MVEEATNGRYHQINSENVMTVSPVCIQLDATSQLVAKQSVNEPVMVKQQKGSSCQSANAGVT